MSGLRAIRGVVSDMDGVLWRGDHALPGLGDFLAFLAQHDIGVTLATNNSGRSSEDYVAKLARLGVTGIAPERIVTSRMAMRDHLLAHYAPGTVFYGIGSTGLIETLESAGFVQGAVDARIVVVGIDTALTYDKLATATRLISAGADFVGTNGDVAIPVGDGIVPGTGSILAAIATATGRQPVVVGKPSRAMFQSALKVLGTTPQETLMIGDRLDTDIAGASGAGLQTGLMLTGITTAEALAGWGGPRPDHVFSDLGQLVQSWRETLGAGAVHA